MRTPASVVKPPPKTEPEPEREEVHSSSSGAVIWVLCVLLMLLGVGGAGGLVYVLKMKKEPEPAPNNVAMAKTPDKKDGGEQSPPIPAPGGKSKGETKASSKDKKEEKGKGEEPEKDDPPPPPIRKSGRSGSNPPPVVTPRESESGAVLLSEDFKKVDLGSRPAGWDGDAFSVLEKDGRRSLMVNKPKTEIHRLTLPKLPIKGDFVVDCEFWLGGRNALGIGPADHQFQLELSGGSSSPMKVVVNHLGMVKLDASSLEKTEDFRPFGDIRFRLLRKKEVYTVSINGQVTTGSTIRNKGAFDEITIGMTGGNLNLSRVGRGGGSPRSGAARLYSVKIRLPTADGSSSSSPSPTTTEEKKGDPLEILRKGQDFRSVTAGTLPPGWKGDDTVICVKRNAGQPGLVLNTGSSGVATLPEVRLNGGFWMETELAIANVNAGVIIQFDVSPQKIFWIEVTGTGKLAVKSKAPAAVVPVDATKVWRRNGQVNKLTLERGKENFVIKVNDEEVASVSPKLSNGSFGWVRLGLQYNPKGFRAQSPIIRSVRLIPRMAGE